MALPHARPFDVVDLHAHDEAGSAGPSVSLMKTPRLQLMRLALGAGQQLPRHHVAGELTIQCLAGEAGIETPHATRRLAAGQLLALPGGEPHAVHAHTPTTLLVTIVRAD